MIKEEGEQLTNIVYDRKPGVLQKSGWFRSQQTYGGTRIEVGWVILWHQNGLMGIKTKLGYLRIWSYFTFEVKPIDIWYGDGDATPCDSWGVIESENWMIFNWGERWFFYPSSQYDGIGEATAKYVILD